MNSLCPYCKEVDFYYMVTEPLAIYKHIAGCSKKYIDDALTPLAYQYNGGLIRNRRGKISDRRAYRDGDRRIHRYGNLRKMDQRKTGDRRKNPWDGRVCRRKSGDRRAPVWGIGPHFIERRMRGERRAPGVGDFNRLRRHSVRRYDDRRRC